ncbi:MAG: putative rane protein [Solirubrobacterales bacterium]|nr:putative rane protein [Solirubrobacterales bacterium]
MSGLGAAPSLLSLPASHWEPAWGLDLAAAVYAGLYLWGARRVRRPWPLARTASFLAGIAVVLVALQSGLDAYDDRLLSAHMVQHTLLLMLAPPLLLLGAPVLLALGALPGEQRQVLARVLERTRKLTTPAVCLAAFSIVVVGFHLPPLFDAAVRHPFVHVLEHVAFLGAGLALWWPLTNGEPLLRHRLGGLGRILYMLVAMVPEDAIGAYLNRANTVFYAPYAGAARALGISAVVDQQQAGAIMWVGSSCIMIAGGLCAAMAAMLAEERRMQRHERYVGVPVGPQTLAELPREETT